METLTAVEPVDQSEINAVLPEIDNLDFSRIKYKLSVKDEGKQWTSDEITFAESEYKRFLTLIKIYPEKSIVPSKAMDEFWHMHILDTEAYRNDCEMIFGRFIDHFPYFGIYGNEDRQNLIDSFEETKEIYLRYFGTQLTDNQESRCENKPCHVTTPCKCR